MKKLKLDVESLCVDSFCASPADAARPGTVHGAMNTDNTCENTPHCEPDTFACTAGCPTYGCATGSGETCFM